MQKWGGLDADDPGSRGDDPKKELGDESLADPERPCTNLGANPDVNLGVGFGEPEMKIHWDQTAPQYQKQGELIQQINGKR
jgi:hypothetical protein